MKAEFHFAGEPVAFALPAAEPATIPATKQDIFDRVVRHYRKQPYACRTKSDVLQCRYWLDGDRCWVGALMTEAEARGMPDKSIQYAIDSGAAPSWMKEHKSFLKELQFMHDNGDYDNMPMVLEMFAAEHGLVMPA
jgi:hypothetical protein